MDLYNEAERKRRSRQTQPLAWAGFIRKRDRESKDRNSEMRSLAIWKEMTLTRQFDRPSNLVPHQTLCHLLKWQPHYPSPHHSSLQNHLRLAWTRKLQRNWTIKSTRNWRLEIYSTSSSSQLFEWHRIDRKNPWDRKQHGSWRSKVSFRYLWVTRKVK